MTWPLSTTQVSSSALSAVLAPSAPQLAHGLHSAGNSVHPTILYNPIHQAFMLCILPTCLVVPSRLLERFPLSW